MPGPALGVRVLVVKFIYKLNYYIMSYRWKPSKTQRREFAQKMSNDPEYAAEYYARREARAEKRRQSSQFKYETAGGKYVPTQAQHDFCVFNRPSNLTIEQEDACNFVASAYACNEKIHHDFIHIVNELIRSNS